MSQILAFVKRVCVQTAVYWGNPQPDGRGGYVFDEPREINVRWDDTSELITANDGKEITSNARILVTEPLDFEGYLYLGSLDDLYTLLGEEPTNPRSIENTYMIKRTQTNPLFRSTDKFVRQVWL